MKNPESALKDINTLSADYYRYTVALTGRKIDSAAVKGRQEAAGFKER